MARFGLGFGFLPLGFRIGHTAFRPVLAAFGIGDAAFGPILTAFGIGNAGFRPCLAALIIVTGSPALLDPLCLGHGTARIGLCTGGVSHGAFVVGRRRCKRSFRRHGRQRRLRIGCGQRGFGRCRGCRRDRISEVCQRRCFHHCNFVRSRHGRHFRKADRSGERHGEEGAGQRCAAGNTAARRNIGHVQTPQTMDDRLVPQNWTRHRRGERRSRRPLRMASEIGNDAGIGSAFFTRAGGHDTRVAGGFLVAAQRAPAQPAKRIEPVDREQRLDGHVDDQVPTAMVGEFVRNREVARNPVAARHEACRQGDDAVEHTESHRPRNGRRFDQAHAADIAHRARIVEQIAAQFEIEIEAARQHDRSTDQPDCHQRQHEVGRVREGLRRRRTSGHIGEEGGRLYRGLVQSERRGFERHLFARGEVHPCRKREWRNEEPRQRNEPQRVGRAGAEMFGNGTAKHHHHRDQGACPHQRVEQEPLPIFAQKLDHFRISLRSASISSRSESVSASFSARWANSGAARPPKRRSTSLRDSPPT